MLLLRHILINFFIVSCFTQHTKIIEKNVFLSRKKRYLAFPENSNFVITMSLTKALMEVQPRGFNALLEIDFPFALPSDTRPFENLKKIKRNHYMQKRDIFLSLERAFNKYGFDGNSCVKRAICEAQQYIDSESKSLVRDILTVLFTDIEVNSVTQKYEKPCYHKSFSECSLPFMKYILGSVSYLT